MFKIISVVIALAILVILALAWSKPDTFSVERSATIAAAPDKIFPFINDFNQWPAWSPWEKMDPDMKKTLSGSPTGAGSIYEWSGNSKVGRGRMEILESVPPSKVTIKLDFLDPFEAHNTAVFTLQPQGAGTQVNWRMDGPSPFMTKVMQVFMNMDKMIGKDFEAGLDNLKKLAEKV